MYCDYKNSSQINFILDVDNSCVQYFCNKFTSQRVKYKAKGILGIPDTCHCKGKNSFYHHWPTSWFIVRNFSTINCWFAFYFKWRVVVNWFLEFLFRLSWKAVCTWKHLMPIESWEIGDCRKTIFIFIII